MLGKAMDFFIPDVKLATLRAIGMKMQVGGVGFYPKSGSPFVHMDVGGVRAWPRMSRDELVRLFPKGNTLHIPADGTPLPGYQQALADYKRRVSSDTLVAAVGGDNLASSKKPKTLFAALFGGGADEEEDSSDDSAPVAVAKATPTKPEAPAAAAEPAVQEDVQVAAVNAPVPQVRPAFAGQLAGGEVANAMLPSNSGNAAQQALAAATAQEDQPQQFADLSTYRVPVPELLGQRREPGDAELASIDPAMPIPTPVDRPVAAENLLAAADPDAAGDEAEAEQLSPAVAQQLAKDGAAASQKVAALAPSTVEQAISAAMPGAIKPAERAPVQLAALAPAKTASFGDSFDLPQRASDDAAPVAPSKGGRPTKAVAAAADAGRASVRTEPKLTQKMISQWALTNARLEMVTKPVKAPRFVSQTLRAQPTAVYAEGFNVKTASIDPGRFSGTAVNFMEVKKFNTN